MIDYQGELKLIKITINFKLFSKKEGFFKLNVVLCNIIIINN